MSSYAKRVALDAGVLISAFQPRSASPTSLQEKAKAFVEELTKSGSDIIVPSISLAEALDMFPVGPQLDAFEDWIEKNIQLGQFDMAAARTMARKFPNAAWKAAIRPGGAYPRQCAKADAMIVATAVSARAEVLYSEDPDVHGLARGRISVERIPTLAQPGLPFPGAIP